MCRLRHWHTGGTEPPLTPYTDSSSHDTPMLVQQIGSNMTKHVNRWLTDKLGRTDCVPAVDQWEIDRLLAF
jgi:hypothetical protein